jgi:hypothetical protein
MHTCNTHTIFEHQNNRHSLRCNIHRRMNSCSRTALPRACVSSERPSKLRQTERWPRSGTSAKRELCLRTRWAMHSSRSLARRTAECDDIERPPSRMMSRSSPPSHTLSLESVFFGKTLLFTDFLGVRTRVRSCASGCTRMHTCAQAQTYTLTFVRAAMPTSSPCHHQYHRIGHEYEMWDGWWVRSDVWWDGWWDGWWGRWDGWKGRMDHEAADVDVYD